MKKVMVFVFLFVFMFSFVSALVPEDCPSDMISYWKLDGNAEDNYDSNGGSWSGTELYSNELKVNGAAVFTGFQKITVSDPANDRLDLTNSFTIYFWVRIDNLKESSLIKKGSNYEIKSLVDGKIEVNIGGRKITSNPLTEEVPYFVALTGYKNTNNVTLYINGLAKESVILGSWIRDIGDPLVFGEGFEGLMDEIAFYETAYGPTEIQAKYANSQGSRDYCYAGSADSSSTRSDFTISGCPLEKGGTLAGRACSDDGYYYCSNGFVLYDTIQDDLGCSEGVVPGSSFDPADGCCPSGYYCDITIPANAHCVRSPDLCSGLNKEQCAEVGLWFESGVEGKGRCVCDPTGLSCSDYRTQPNCETDALNLGSVGYDTEKCISGEEIDCDINFLLNGCSCSWNATIGSDGGCELSQLVSSSVYGDGTNHTFRWNKFFTMGECVDGEQNVECDSNLVEISSGATAHLNPAVEADKAILDCLKSNLNCADTIRVCGEEIVKLPGFSLFAFITSLSIIGIFYLFREMKFRR